MIKFSNLVSQVISKITNTAIAIILYYILCLVYSNVVVAIYSFGGFITIDEPQHFYALLVLFISALLMPNVAKNSKDIFLLISFYFLILPATVLCSMQGSSPYSLGMIFFGVVSVAIFYSQAQLIACRFFGTPKICIEFGSPIYFWLPLLFMTAVFMGLAIHENFQLKFSFEKVYEHRFDFNDSIKFPMNYLLPLSAGPIASFLAALSFSRRQWMRLLVTILMSALFYGLSTHKSFLFTPFLTIIFYMIIVRKLNLYYSIAIFIGFGATLALFNEGYLGQLFGSIFSNRILFIPAQIHYVFIDEFSKIGYLYWAESKITMGLVDSPLKLNSVNYIAEVMTGNSEIGANVGWIANGFMNLGAIGILVYSFLISILLCAVDRLSNSFSNAVLLSAFGAPYFLLITSNDFFTSLLTSGILPFLLILQLMIASVNVRSSLFVPKKGSE